MTENCKILQLENKLIFSDQKSKIKNQKIYLFLVLQEGRPSYRRSLQPSKETIQYRYFKTIYYVFFPFCGSFLPTWIRIRIPNADPDPDPADQHQYQYCGSGSTTPFVP
jgi:hypothetical protein